MNVRRAALISGFLVALLTSGCPAGDVRLGVSESTHDFGDSECLWTFYVYNPGAGAGTFRVASDASWAKVITPAGLVGPYQHMPVIVRVDRSQLGKSDHEAYLTVSYGDDDAFGDYIQLYATNGEPSYVRLRDYWPFEVGRTWTYASHAEDVGGPAGDTTLVETSRLTVRSYTRRFGMDVWETEYEEIPTKTTSTLYAIFFNEYPVFVEDEDVVCMLPNTDTIFDATFSGPFSSFWYKGLFAPVDLGGYSNTTRSTVLPLRDITPMNYAFTAGKIYANEFPVARGTSCLALLDDPYFTRFRRNYFAILAEGVGPLMDPFGGSGILQSVTHD